MADFNALEALINAYIKQNGVQAITGQVLNGVLRGMVSALGKGWTIAEGDARPDTDPGTMTGPVAYVAHTAGTYVNFGGLIVNDGEVALLKYDEQTWTKEVLASLSAVATVDDQEGTPYVDTQFVNGVLTFAFHNIKGTSGHDGDAAGFGTVDATVDNTSGTPAVSVQSSGPNTAKNFTFAFTGLKGAAGVTSAVVTVDNTSGSPACAVSLVGQELHLDFTGLKGAQGDTGSSVDYPFTIVNNCTTNDPTQALSAAQGVYLDGKVTQLEAEKADKDMVRAYMMSDRAKNALLEVLDKVAFAVPDVSDEMDELTEALFNLDEVVGVEATYTQGATVIWSDGVSSLDDLLPNLVVKAVYGDGTKAVVHNFILSGSLTAGTSTITVTYLGEFIDTFDVTVTEYGSKMSYALTAGELVYKRGRTGTYNTDYAAIENYEQTSEKTRRVVGLEWGKYPEIDINGNPISLYRIKIPKTAVSVIGSVAPAATIQIALRVEYQVSGNLFIYSGSGYPYKMSYALGSTSLDLSNIVGREDAYLNCWLSRPNNAQLDGNEATAISIQFSTE